MTKLESIRKSIDEIDRELVELFEKRMKAAEEVAEFKLGRGMEVLDAEREKQVIASRGAQASEEANRAGVVQLYNTLMRLSRKRQRELIGFKSLAYAEFLSELGKKQERKPSPHVIFQGRPGAFGEEAARAYFENSGGVIDSVSTFENVFIEIQGGRADYGVLPIENSSTGSISKVYDLLSGYGCKIVGEQLVSVDQCLMAIEGAVLDTITEVYSHEQGFLQCDGFLSERPAWKLNVCENTALAAEYVSTKRDTSKAAIAGAVCAEIYGLQILRHSINAAASNTTRFVIVAKHFEPEGSDKISVMFTLPHRAGSLNEALEAFGDAGLNLLKLESRPIKDRNWEYNFFADFEGSLENELVLKALGNLMEDCLSFKVLGAYKSGELR